MYLTKAIAIDSVPICDVNFMLSHSYSWFLLELPITHTKGRADNNIASGIENFMGHRPLWVRN